jgi:hypothetical protein
MKSNDLVPGVWYYNAENYDGCKYFVFLEHNIRYSIRGIGGRQYWGNCSTDNKFREMTPEEKLEFL